MIMPWTLREYYGKIELTTDPGLADVSQLSRTSGLGRASPPRALDAITRQTDRCGGTVRRWFIPLHQVKVPQGCTSIVFLPHTHPDTVRSSSQIM